MRAALQKELGEQLVAAGLIGAALKLFEAAELWDPLALCLRLTGKHEAAHQLLLRRLEVPASCLPLDNPERPNLWMAVPSASGKHHKSPV